MPDVPCAVRACYAHLHVKAAAFRHGEFSTCSAVVARGHAEMQESGRGNEQACYLCMLFVHVHIPGIYGVCARCGRTSRRVLCIFDFVHCGAHRVQ